MVPVDLATIAASLAMLGLVFRRHIPHRYDAQRLALPTSVIRDWPTFRAGWAVLAWLLVGFFGLEPAGIPVSATAALGALCLMGVAARGGRVPVGRIVRGAPWQIIVFSLGMYLVVYGLRHAGLTQYLTDALDLLAGQGIWVATVGTGLLSAVLSSVMNNLPTVLIGALSIDASQAHGAIRLAMIHAHVIGCDLGPKLTPIGSLATLLWLHVLRQRDIRIGWGLYCRIGLVLTLPVLSVALLVLAWLMRLAGPA
jgi:arsenical pump membrane protein